MRAALMMTVLLCCAPQAFSAEAVYECRLGNDPKAQQLIPFKVEGKVLHRLRGKDHFGAAIPATHYPIIADDGDTVVAATLDTPALTAFVVLARRTGVLKVGAVSSYTDPPDVIVQGTCVKQ
jgi:hypothetical protein